MCFSLCAKVGFVVLVAVVLSDREECECETRRWTFCDSTQEDLCLLTVVVVVVGGLGVVSIVRSPEPSPHRSSINFSRLAKASTKFSSEDFVSLKLVLLILSYKFSIGLRSVVLPEEQKNGIVKKVFFFCLNSVKVDEIVYLHRLFGSLPTFSIKFFDLIESK